MKYPFWTLLLLARAALANPTGEQVVRGDALFIRPSDNELHIHQQNERAIIEWNDFSIGANELTKFIQPTSGSVLLNRVVGQEISKLYGTLEANGQIVLINPHGVIVGETGVINAAAFLSSAYDLSNDDFFDGKLDFSPTDLRSVINIEGRIEAVRVDRIGGRIFLVADEVSVAGELFSPGGEIELNGNYIALTQEGVLDASGLENGDGGRAIIFAEKSADFSGSIYAKGGSSSGDGGFIEVSSCGRLGLTGNVSTMAPNGKTGMFLIDPTNVFISNSPNVDVVGGAVYTFTGSAANIQDTSLCGFLNASSVTVDTSNTIDQGQVGDLTIDASASFATWVTPGNSLILKANNNIQVKATVGALGVGVPGDFLAQAGGNIQIIGAIYTDGFEISLRAGPLSGIAGFNPNGSVSLTNVLDTTQGGGVGASLLVEGYNITSASASPHRTNAGSASFHANNDITFTASGIVCTGPFVGTQIDVQADFDHDGVGNLLYQGSAAPTSSWSTDMGGSIFVGAHNFTMLGATAGAGIGSIDISTLVDGNIEIQVANDFTMQGGSRAVGSSAVSLQSTGNVLVRAGNDIILQGGTGLSSVALVGGTFDATIIAGRDIQLLGGFAPGTIVFAEIQGDQSFLSAGRDIIHSSGDVARSEAITESTSVSTIMKAGRHTLFRYGSSGADAGISNNSVGCNVQAGGDIQWAMSLNSGPGESIYIQADAELFPIYSAQIGPYLTGTALSADYNVPKDSKGSFSVNTSPLGGGIEFVSTDGPISLYSAANSFAGVATNILFDETVVNNALRIVSTSGDISVGSFHNTNIANTISTAGAILIATNNDININAPAGFVTAGGPITLIVDEQTPLTNGGGFFNNFNSGVFTTDPQQRIAIYAASGPMAPVGFSFPNQVVLGNLSSVMTWDSSKPLGLLSKYGTSYQNGGRFHGGGFSSSYVAGNGVFSSPVIWYKIFAILTGITDEALASMQEIRSLIPERLWVQEFSLLVDRVGFEKQVIRLMDHQRREGSIQSRYAIASSRDFFMRSTMSGENIRLLDRYQEFEQSPFWRTPDQMNTLDWLELVE